MASTNAPKSSNKTTKEISCTLGKLAEDIQGQFCYGGVIENASTSVVFKTDLPNQWKQLAFPASTEADLEPLLRAGTVASFGIGSEQVTDQTYRNALKLDVDDFVTPFCPYSSLIIEEIAGVMVPHIKSIKAELYKLNVYSTGGFFKAHVDTPRSSDMFGSLVVCLPSQFKGGELVTRHEGREVKFDWSEEQQQLPTSIKWAAFFSDVQHEILPVTSGYRFTLTYNLYSPQQSVMFRRPTINVSLTPLYSELQAALSENNFMTDGGVLGFATHHTYVFPDLNDEKAIQLILKGADRILFQIALSLGLEVMVKPIVQEGGYEGYCTDYWRKYYLLPTFPKKFYYDDMGCDETAGIEDFEYLFEVKPCDIGTITWCEKHKIWQPAAATVHYGNNYTCTCFYQAAAILVGIPRWDKDSNSRTVCADKNMIRKFVNFCEEPSKYMCT